MREYLIQTDINTFFDIIKYIGEECVISRAVYAGDDCSFMHIKVTEEIMTAIKLKFRTVYTKDLTLEFDTDDLSDKQVEVLTNTIYKTHLLKKLEKQWQNT